MKFLRRYKNYYFPIAALCVLGCSPDDLSAPSPTASPLPAGSEYYPLTIGQYSTYNVEDIRYSLRDGADTMQYQLQERVTDSLTGAGGEIIYTLERYSRSSSAATWQLDSTWTARKSEQRLVVVENNIPFVKLIFPFQEALEWDGNALNSRPEQTYLLTATDSTLRREMGNNLLLKDCRTVIQRQLETLVNDSVMVETYSANVGLVYRKNRILQYCADENCIGQQLIESGRVYRQTLIEYGKN